MNDNLKQEIGGGLHDLISFMLQVVLYEDFQKRNEKKGTIHILEMTETDFKKREKIQNQYIKLIGPKGE